MLLESPEAVTIVDLKTSRSRWSAEQVDDQAEQLLLYSELVRWIVPGKSLRLQFAVITKTKDPSVELHEVSYSAVRVERTGSLCVASGVPLRAASSIRPHRSWAAVAVRFESLVVCGRANRRRRQPWEHVTN